MRHRLLDFNKLKFEIRDTMRYDDVGDYYDHTIVAYDMKDQVINNAILIHEFIEYNLIKSAGISPELIDKFDVDPNSPYEYPREYNLYTKFHRMANKIERQYVENLGLNWVDYDKTIWTTRVQTAVQKVTDQLHRAKPSEERIERSRKVIEEVLENKNR